MHSHPSVSVLIIALNEEKKIGRALQSASWADDLVVIDGGSSDSTVAICQKAGARVVTRRFDNFSSQRKFGLEQIHAPWVFSLDADEEISKELSDEICRMIRHKSLPCQSYCVARQNFFAGKQLRYIWANDWPLRLFRRENAQVSPTPVHEGYLAQEPMGKITVGCIRHFTYDSISQYIAKMNLYTRLSAPSLAQRCGSITFLTLLAHPFSEWFRTYVAHKGFMDGFMGLQISFLSALYNFTEYAKAREIQDAAQNSSYPHKQDLE